MNPPNTPSGYATDGARVGSHRPSRCLCEIFLFVRLIGSGRTRRASTDFRAYSLNPIIIIIYYISNNVNINSATDRTSIKCHKICKDNRESLNRRLLQASYCMRNILDLSAIVVGALCMIYDMIDRWWSYSARCLRSSSTAWRPLRRCTASRTTQPRPTPGSSSPSPLHSSTSSSASSSARSIVASVAPQPWLRVQFIARNALQLLHATVTFCVSRRRRKNVLWSRASVCLCVCLSVCLSAAVCPHYCTDPVVTWGHGRGCPLLVHNWADLQSGHGLRCYGNITRTLVTSLRPSRDMTT